MALSAVGLKTAIWNNNFRSMALMAVYPFILMGIVWAVAAAYGLSLNHAFNRADPDIWRRAALTGNLIVGEWWPAILTVVAIWFLIAGFFHTRMVRALSSSHPVTREEEPELYRLLENLCISRGISVPRLEIVETDALNAFASGVSRGSYSITVTRGLLQALKPDEVEAVLGHELTHIMNSDVRLLIISIIFVGMLGFMMQMFWRFVRTGSRGRGKKDGRLMLFFLVVAVILSVGYLVTIFTRFALSRRREFMADAGSVELTKNPDAMMRALLRIAGHDRIPQATGDIAMMCIENSQPFFGMFSTHPSLEERLREISTMTHTPVPDISGESGPWGAR